MSLSRVAGEPISASGGACLVLMKVPGRVTSVSALVSVVEMVRVPKSGKRPFLQP
jgi:hypothetical protein